MEELNTLISPYKKLKVGPPEDLDGAALEPESVKQSRQVSECERDNLCFKGSDKCDQTDSVKHLKQVSETDKGNLSFKNDGLNGQEELQADANETNVESASSDEIAVTNYADQSCAESFANTNEDVKETYVDIATAMLVGDAGVGHSDNEGVANDTKDMEKDSKQSCKSLNLQTVLTSDGLSESVNENQDDVKPQENIGNKENMVNDSEDMTEALEIVNACMEEVETLMELRKTEVEALCSSVNVGSLVKQMEDRFKQKVSEDCESLPEESQLSDLPSSLNESLTSENTDELNSSTKTVVDTTGQAINENVGVLTDADDEINNIVTNGIINEDGLSDYVDEDLDLLESLDDTVLEDNVNQACHYQHVFANVVIEKHNRSGETVKISEQGFDNLMRQSCVLDSSSEEEDEATEIFPDTMDNDCTRRIEGDGKEYDEKVGNYFSAVNAEDNNVELGQLVDEISAEQNVEGFENDLTGINRPNSELVSFSQSRVAYPLCASTPLPNTDGFHNNEKHKPKNYDVENHSNKDRNSEPLCASTPITKSNLGLRERDMNIMANHDSKRQVKFTEKIQGVKISLNSDFVNEDCGKGDENYIIGRTNNKNVKYEDDVSRGGRFKRDRDSKREKKKMKGVRKEKFKEYMGPGLTSAPGGEENMVETSEKNTIKNTDVETCTLIEYKGFGLTGPLPDKPKQTSTPLPPFAEGSSQVGHGVNVRNGLRRCISGTSLGGRPAGTEGMLIDGVVSNKVENGSEVSAKPFHGGTGVKLRQTVSESKFGQKPLAGVPELNVRTLSRHTSDLGPHGYTRHNRLTGWLASVQKTQLPTLLENNNQAAASATLKPDQAYPSVTSVKGGKSDSNSNADKSDKSGKVVIDPSFLQTTGQLKISAYMNFGLLTVHVIQGRQLSTKWKSTCDSFVKLSLLPDDGKKPKCKTEVVQDTNNPLYDEKFSFELNEEDHSKRLMISVWHRDTTAGANEFLGCMSFGIRHLTNPKKEVNNWYYLLTEDVGRKKHLQVSHRQYPQLKVRNQSQIPSVNKDVWGTESLTLTLHRGKTGFGFSVIEACPVRVGRVDGTSPAEASGLQPGDIIIRLNRQNVSRSTATSVAKLIKHSSNTMVLELHRPRPVTYEHLENSPLKASVSHGTNTFNTMLADNLDQSVPQMYTLNDDEDKENTVSLDDQTLYPINPHIASLATSTPLPLLARGHRTVQTCEVRKQEAIHRLLTLELDFIDLMHAGMQRYSRPLRHCILSHTHHSTLFQNIEKLVTISEYHVKQMHDNAPSSFISEDDTDTSGSSDNHNFIQSIGLIYQSKVHMLCQAYDLYAKGISAANVLLSELRRNEDFVRFVRDPPLQGNQPSISTFVYRPVQHIRDLCKVLQDIFNNTSTDSSDYNSLKEIVEGLQECSTNITNYSCERVESLTSLTSRDSKTSFTCSMKSKSSSTSCSSASSKGHSLQTSKAVDHEVMKIQDRLVFPSNVPVLQLCQDDRHLIFSGDMFKWDGRQWIKIHVYLFTDLILETIRECDGYLKVISEPTLLRDVAAMDAQRQHATEFVLYCSARLHDSRHSGKRKLNFRAPSTEQKMAWKSLIEQRVFAVRGSMDFYSSTSDVSSSSASAIVI